MSSFKKEFHDMQPLEDDIYKSIVNVKNLSAKGIVNIRDILKKGNRYGSSVLYVPDLDCDCYLLQN